MECCAVVFLFCVIAYSNADTSACSAPDLYRIFGYLMLFLWGGNARLQMVETLFHFYFENERDIADVDTLVEAADAVGVPNVSRIHLPPPL